MRTICLSAFLALLVAGCSDTAAAPGRADAGAGTIIDAGASADALTPAQRGDYLVNAVLSCRGCHTPLTATGAPDLTKAFSGRTCFLDTMPPADNGMGCVNSRNLTNHETGLKNLTDAQIKKALTQGVRANGKILHSAMEYWTYGPMLTSADQDAIIAYLRTIPGIDNTVPPNEPPFDNITNATPPLSDSDLPPAGGTGDTLASAKRGRYLSVACLGCHTPVLTPPVPRPADVAHAFQGGRRFLGVAVQPSGVDSANLTPHATGLGGWTVADVVRALKEGKDNEGVGICPPMPSGMAGFNRLTDADATDLANYFLNLAPVDHAIAAPCSLPPQ
jgi:hypothetical protein